MAWYRGGTAASPEDYTTRIEWVASSTGVSTIDGTISLTDADVEFWAAITAAGDTSGHRIVFTQADGVTELAWERATWSYANRLATINIDAISLGTSSEATHIIYMFVGNTDSGDLATSPTISAAVTFRSAGARPRDVITLPATPPPGSSAPTVRIQKTASEQRTVWVDVRHLLATVAAKGGYHGTPLWEEVAYVILNVLSSGADQSALYDNDKIRLYRGFIRILLKAGSSGTTYTISLRVATATPLEPVDATNTPTRILDLRALLVVEDIDES